jgi:hypothetical protein
MVKREREKSSLSLAAALRAVNPVSFAIVAPNG